MYEFTQKWFKKYQPLFEKYSGVTHLDEIHILEIGCFEGMSTVFFSDNYLYHPRSTLDCVDTFSPSEEYHVTPETFKRFSHNVNSSLHSSRITLFHNDSEKALEYLVHEQKMYDLVFLDGSRELEKLNRDVERITKLLPSRGLLITALEIQPHPNLKKLYDHVYEATLTSPDT
jgi:predicted O-methyltransferase YrrM